MRKPISIIEVRRSYEKNTFSIVFDSADLMVEFAEDGKDYPEGTIFITTSDKTEQRYAIIPTNAA